jgi:dipeptidyl-peptidase III
MKKLIYLSMFSALFCLSPCSGTKKVNNVESFNYIVDQFADMQILRYQVPGFEDLSLKQKELIYYLNEAALTGRDILYDQNCRYNLCVRRTLEAVYQYGQTNKIGKDWREFEIYLKRVWVSNGIHHHYATDKFVPGFSKEFFSKAILSVNKDSLPLNNGETVDNLINKLTPVIFDPSVDAKRVNQANGQDLITTSANNYYQDVTQKEAEDFYNKLKDPKENTPVSYGLNSRLVKENGQIVEKTWKTDGLYGTAITKIIYWLEKAIPVAENEKQANVIRKLIEYYKTGDLKTFDDYSILWVEDLNSNVDFVNGFIESYGDPIGLKASWESIVNFKNAEATKRTETISSNAQWFEDHSPVSKEFKKEKVKGVSAKVINVTILAGDCYPTTPIGINLPNANWIRRDHGSKSVTIENITEAYDKASFGTGFNEEFAWSDNEVKMLKKYSFLTDNLHTDLHECLGHGSGKLLPGVDPDGLGAYGSTIEEARADLFGLYYLADPKMVALKLVPNQSAYQAEYYKYLMNGLLTQLVRIEPGNNLEESHMRNRALIAHWILEKATPSKAVEFKKRNGKTFVVINDYKQVRNLFGKLLAEIQRIRSTGDFKAAQKLVETYAVKIDPTLHQEILKRYKALNLAPYKGFVNPVYTPVYDAAGKIKDIKVSYTEGYAEQHLRYSKQYKTLPTYN